ncbi:hypothetical protein [Actinomycetospora cinnamomea]|uniref:Uncharacterized protein n=1 Tax=Actinomycetospora cinnamomea TaxID=663609 RepID=A0A2U1EZM7_9PSEU|nr:hypothetical protein [Actinomycetospora cinnamomea]PVZ05375.1 hypothetical protein C8D89_11580 [Actinomycetospora cinnamomea]
MTLDPARHDALPAAAVAPDLPHPILGWRTWRIGRRAARRTDLIAPLAGLPWPARQAMAASCGSRTHSPPGDRCGCGLYAVADPGTLEWGPSDHEVLGVVALWGRVVEGTRGWRASHGYPRLVVTGPAITAEQRAALSRRYGVPVHRSAVPAKALASLLGADAARADVLRRGTEAEVDALLAARMPDWVRRWELRRAQAEARARRPRWSALGRRRSPVLKL